MIIDSLKNSSLYEGLNPLFAKAFEYLKTLDFANLEVGKTVLVENELMVAVSDTTLRAAADAKPEIHNKYIDIQLPVNKTETFGWSSRTDVKDPVGKYNDEKDILFYKDEPVTHFNLNPGDFAIFFPNDVHAPCIGEGNVRKIVVKVIVK